MRLWIQAAFAALALAAGTIAIGGTVVGVSVAAGALHFDGSPARVPNPALVGTMIGSSLLTVSFGFGLGLAFATLLEALGRWNARRNRARVEASPIVREV